MKRRSSEILYRLCENSSQSIRIQTLVDDYHVSEKTLRGDFQSIGDFVALPDGTSPIVVSSHHVRLARDINVADIVSLLQEMDLYEYILSSNERMQFIVVALLAQPAGTWLSSQRLADEMFVTRTTVMADCKAADDYLTSHGITMESRSHRGMRVHANDDARRAALVDLFAVLFGERRSKGNFFLDVLSQRLGYGMSANAVIEHMQEFLRQRNSLILPTARNVIAACLFVMLNELRSEQKDLEGCQTNRGSGEAFEADLIGELFASVTVALGFDPPGRTMIDEFERLVLSRNLEPHIRRFESFDLRCAVMHFLLLVGRDLGVSLQTDDLLVDSLISHIKGYADWSFDEFELDVSGQDNTLMQMVRATAESHYNVLESFLHRSFERSMRASLAIHICAALYREESGQRRCRVQVVAGSSVVARKYLSAQVRRYFNLEVVDCSPSGRVSDLESTEKDEVDFVISTVPLEVEGRPVVVVSPVLSIENINEIQELAFRCSHDDRSETSANSSILARITDLYAQGCRRKVESANQAIASILDALEEAEEETSATSPLLTMLGQRFIRMEEGPLEWRKAIQMAAERMVADGYVLTSYVDKAIWNVEEYGSYIVVNRGLAFAHARAIDGVLRDGIALLVCREGIRFDDVSDPVSLLFFYAQRDDGASMLDLFREVVSLGNDRQGFASVRFSESATEARQRIVEMLTDYDAGLSNQAASE